MTARFLVLAVAMVLALAAQVLLERGDSLYPALGLHALTACVALWGLRRVEGWGAEGAVAVPSDPNPGRPASDRRRGAGWGLVAASAALSASLAIYLWDYSTDPLVPYGWLLSIFLLFAGLYLAQGAGWSGSSLPIRRLLNRLAGVAAGSSLRWELAGLLAILACGAFLRFYALDSAPAGSLDDEAWFGPAVMALARGQEGPIRSPFGVAIEQPNLPYYPLALLYQLTGPSILAARVQNGLIGLAAVGVFYLLARRLFGVIPSLAGAFLFSVSRWQVHYSRIGWENLAHVVLAELLVLYFLLRGARTGHRTDFAWAGLFTGLSLYLYSAGRLILPAAGLLLGYHLLRERQWVPKRVLGEVAVFALAAGIAVAPLAAMVGRDPDPYFHRASEVSLWRYAEQEQRDIWPLLADNLGGALLMFNYRGDTAARHNIPGAPGLDTITAALFVLGALWAARRVSTLAGMALASWLLVFLLGTALALPHNNPMMPRAIGASAPALLLVAGFLGEVWKAGKAALGRGNILPVRPTRVAGLVAGIALLGAAGFLNYDAYFERWAKRQDVWYQYQNPAWKAAELFRIYSPSYQVFIPPEYAAHHVIRFAVAAYGGSYRTGGAEAAADLGSRGQAIAVILLPEDEEERELLCRRFPAGTLLEFTSPWGRSFLYLFTYLAGRF